MALLDACVDLSPPQSDAVTLAPRNPLSASVLIAGEVGVGKIGEAGLILCHYWGERRRRFLILRPAGVRKQGRMELEEKFNLPNAICDARTA